MSSGSLFDSEAKHGSNFKILAIAIIALIVLSGSAFTLYWYSKPVGPSADEVLGTEIRDTTVMMLAQPTFSGEDFRQQILGKGRLVKYVRSLKDAYFTYPKTDPEEFDTFLAKYFIDKSKIDYAKDENGQAKLGGYTLNIPPDEAYFFRTTLDNIQIEPKQNLSFQLKDAIYNVSLAELRNLENNSELYGGKLIARMPERRDEPQFVFANHGVMVAKPDEPSLKRLVDELLKNAGPSREERIQKLVDFVSNDIDYSFTEAVGTNETLKRASETLMTRSGDCSNKTILLASLLEQIGEEYILLYCPQHITVAVPLGNFNNENKLDFTWNQKPWVIAETTMPGFQVGKSKVSDPIRLTSVNYVQNPKNADVIFDANSFEVLKFY